MYFKCYCKLQNLVLLYYAFDYTPRLSFVISSIGMPCFFAISPLGILAWPPSCDQHLSLCVFMTCAGSLCCNHATNSESCCYTFFPFYILATAVFVSCLVNMVSLSCWFSHQRVVLLLQPLGCIIRIATLEYGLPAASILRKGYHLLSLAW